MDKLINLLKTHGPMTGKELHQKTAMDVFNLWKSCNQNADIVTKNFGTRYLRLDRNVDGFARLSPSIIREFYNYTVISLKSQAEMALSKAEELHRHIIAVSQNKFALALETMEKNIASQPEPEEIKEKVCFIIAGDVAYEMAHLEPRPEFSTGQFVNGSDLDIVIIYKDLPERLISELDASIYRWKYYLLANPSYKEEIDYCLKDISKVEKQLAFEDFESMVASKVLDEGKFLCGSFQLFTEIKNMVAERGIPEKLASLTEKATMQREKARMELLASNDAINDKELRQLFYTTDEKEEFF